MVMRHAVSRPGWYARRFWITYLVALLAAATVAGLLGWLTA
jgi:hypothetical protein